LRVRLDCQRFSARTGEPPPATAPASTSNPATPARDGRGAVRGEGDQFVGQHGVASEVPIHTRAPLARRVADLSGNQFFGNNLKNLIDLSRSSQQQVHRRPSEHRTSTARRSETSGISQVPSPYFCRRYALRASVVCVDQARQ
jgi:hypothetical protein